MSVKLREYLRDNRLGVIGLGFACVALVSLALPIRLATAVGLGTTILIATLAAIVVCLFSIARDRSKLLGCLGILTILVGETYKLPIILINAFTLVVLYLPFILAAILIGVLVHYLYRRTHKSHLGTSHTVR